MSSNLPAIIGAFVSDGLSLVQVPGAGAAGVGIQMALERVMTRREESAREVLLGELRRGKIAPLNAAAEDDAAAILFRYLRAAQEGAARWNLRLLAQVIRGQMVLGNLVADEFLSYADVLASLRREEIVLLGAMAQRRDQLREEATSDQTAFKAWTAIEDELSGTPIFPTKDHLKASASALGRHGLVLMVSLWDGNLPVLSVLFDRIAALCDFEAAAAED